jgi:succinoglycan biosynthesis protein ExoA
VDKPLRLVDPKNDSPSVSIVMPVRNEAACIRESLLGLIRQDYGHIEEIIVVDGMSQDGTRGTVRVLSTAFQRHGNLYGGGPRIIRLLDNPGRLQVPARNIGIREARGEVILFADAHAEYAPDYVRRLVRCLVETGAANAGSIARTRNGRGLIPGVIGALHHSRLGIGAARFRHLGSGGWAEHGWLGCYWKFILDRLGGYRQELERSHDIDLDARLRALGYGIYLCPEAKAYYVPRASLRGLWRQNFGNGMAVMQSLFIDRRALSSHHLVPFVFVSGLLLFLLLAPFGRIWIRLLLAMAGLYLAAVLTFSVRDAVREGLRLLPLLPLSYCALHLCYGAGSWWGLLRLAARRARGRALDIFG